MRNFVKALTLALALGFCLSAASFALGEGEEAAGLDREAAAPVELVEAAPETEATESAGEATESVCEATEVAIEAEEPDPPELVEIEDSETPLGLFAREAPFTGTVELERRGAGALSYGDRVELSASVRGANAPYELRWEVNRRDEAGWTAIERADGADYDFILTPENADYEYRVVLVTEA